MVLRISPGAFIGRTTELEEFRRVLASSRVVTLTGTGGIGKTRMAVETAHRVTRAFRDGVWFVPLADLEPSAGREAVARVILMTLQIDDRSDVRPDVKLLEHVAERQMLLVLDNCEHLLVETAALTADILTVSPHVSILATSREALGIAGERTFVLSPLPLPEPGRGYRLPELLRIDSVRLLLERAQAVDAHFAIEEADIELVAQLCSQLDGLPLAIELAATRLRSMSLEQMVDRLADRFSLLARGDRSALPRQSSLRAVIEWSYDLCPPLTRKVWNRLSVFPSSFDAAAAEAVCAYGPIRPDEVFDHIDRLVAQSILTTERVGQTVRYRLPMTLREYAAEKIQDRDALLESRHRLRDHLLMKATATIAGWAGPAQRGALSALAADHPSLESCLGWSLIDDDESHEGLRLATAFRYHWLLGGHLAAGRGWLERFLGAVPEDSLDRGEALWTVSWIALIQGDREGAGRHIEQLTALASRLGDSSLDAHVHHWRALRLAFAGDVEESLPGLRLAVRGHHLHGDVSLELTASFQLAYALANADHVAEALDVCTTAIPTADAVGECFNHAWLLWVTALGRWRSGAFDEAERTVMSVLDIERDFQDRLCISLSVALLSFIATSREQYDRATELAELTNRVCAESGTSLEAYGPRLRADADACAATILAATGKAPASTWHPGSSSVLPMSEVIDRALGSGSPGHDKPRDRIGNEGGLTDRELEVARLIADGHSNRAVAERLVVSVRTVDGHVQRILGKLEVRSRTGIARWVLEHAGAHDGDVADFHV